jgi:hypothetical protein
MANMSYCRFENTLEDLRDCRDALSELNSVSDIESDSERKAAQRLIKMCKRIADDWGDEGE